MPNTDKITALAKEKACRREEEILEYIRAELKLRHNVTFYSVARDKKASKSYLYGNEKIRAAIGDARGQTTASQKSKDTVIKMQKLQIQKLENKLKKMEALEAENRELKKQLEAAYKSLI